MATRALLLNADFQPIKVIDWERAVILLLDGTAEMVEEYAGRLIRSVSTSMPWPAVIRLRRYVKDKVRLRFNRQNVLARDGYTCAYCGAKPVNAKGRPLLEDLTLDHVVPRAQVSKDGTVRLPWNNRRVSITSWENVVTSCGGPGGCNDRKGGRTPDQAGMKLLWIPRSPTAVDVLRISLRKIAIPNEWAEWLPPGAEDWSGYWEDELVSE